MRPGALPAEEMPAEPLYGGDQVADVVEMIKTWWEPRWLGDRASGVEVLARGPGCESDATICFSDDYAKKSFRRKFGVQSKKSEVYFPGRLNIQKKIFFDPRGQNCGHI